MREDRDASEMLTQSLLEGTFRPGYGGRKGKEEPSCTVKVGEVSAIPAGDLGKDHREGRFTREARLYASSGQSCARGWDPPSLMIWSHMGGVLGRASLNIQR